MKRIIFFVSDRTGITAETLGHSLLTQFDSVDFEQTTYPFIDTVEKAQRIVELINQTGADLGSKVIVFATIVDPEIQRILASSQGLIFDFFNTYIEPLESEINMKSSYYVGRSHGIKDRKNYNSRIEAVNFALSCDDGVGVQHYKECELILLGVSRCGKTPASLYLALQFGIYVANYPFTEDDFEKTTLPIFLQENRKKLFGLTINPQRLHTIRTERRPHSHYASLEQCQKEIKQVEALYRREQIQFINTTSQSIEEISATILAQIGLKRHSY